MNHGHLVNHITHPELLSDNTLHVIGVCSNPVRYHSRYRIFREWQAAMQKTKNVHVYSVESAYGDRQFEVTQAGNPDHLQLRTKSQVWTKENMINLAVQHLLPKDWKYVAWIDGDVFFRDDSWALETMHQLQQFEIVQPWTDCLDLGPNGNVFQHFKSFGLQHQRRIPKQKWPGEECPYAHSGFAWACTRKFWENARGLMDFAILGSADHHMAFAMIGEVDDTIHQGMSPSFFRRCHEWQTRVMKVTHGEVGFVNGRIEHQFHGPKKRRYYRERWQILIDNHYDPDKDLVYDTQGLIQLVNNPALEHDIALYNLSRYEDSIEQD